MTAAVATQTGRKEGRKDGEGGREIQNEKIRARVSTMIYIGEECFGGERALRRSVGK